jgi:hypothetical protein
MDRIIPALSEVGHGPPDGNVFFAFLSSVLEGEKKEDEDGSEVPNKYTIF